MAPRRSGRNRRNAQAPPPPSPPPEAEQAAVPVGEQQNGAAPVISLQAVLDEVAGLRTSIGQRFEAIETRLDAQGTSRSATASASVSDPEIQVMASVRNAVPPALVSDLDGGAIPNGTPAIGPALWDAVRSQHSAIDLRWFTADYRSRSQLASFSQPEHEHFVTFASFAEAHSLFTLYNCAAFRDSYPAMTRYQNFLFDNAQIFSLSTIVAFDAEWRASAAQAGRKTFDWAKADSAALQRKQMLMKVPASSSGIKSRLGSSPAPAAYGGLNNVTCYNCGERGHYSPFCSQPRQQSYQRDLRQQPVARTQSFPDSGRAGAARSTRKGTPCTNWNVGKCSDSDACNWGWDHVCDVRGCGKKHRSIEHNRFRDAPSS